MTNSHHVLLTTLLFILPWIVIPGQRCVKYVKYQGKNVTLKGTKLKHSLVRTAEVDLGELELNQDWRWASQEIQSLDLLQYSICQQLKCMQKEHWRTNGRTPRLPRQDCRSGEGK